MIFGRKRNIGSQGLTVYSEPLERVRVFKFPGVWMDEKLTYKEHVCEIVSKYEKVINDMRCLAG